jgi:DNA-binding protein H-NS
MSGRKLMYLDGEARDRMIRFLRRRMEDWNISMDDIFDDNVTQYQDVFGNSWDGQGEQPVWIKRALSLGLNLDHFRVRH